jgi:hypothetical protein
VQGAEDADVSGGRDRRGRVKSLACAGVLLSPATRSDAVGTRLATVQAKPMFQPSQDKLLASRTRATRSKAGGPAINRPMNKANAK